MKNVVVDFSDYDLVCGFGEIARNFSCRLASIKDQDLHFMFILPKRHHGIFGSHIDYISNDNIKKDTKLYSRQIDLWHATHQLFRYRYNSKNTIQLLTVHDLNYIYEKRGIHLLRHQIQMPLRIRKSDCVTVISEYVKEEIKQHIPFLNKEPIVIYNGIRDIENIPRLQPDFIKNKHEKFFLCIGQVREKKNIHTAIQMMKHFPNHNLYICGDNHWNYTKSLQSIISPEDTKRIIITGLISEEEKAWLYAHTEALLFPSRHEGFGIPVLEAMRFGTKVFSSRFSCLPEICKDYASYWDSYEPQAMAQVVKMGLASWNRNSDEANEALNYSASYNYDRYTTEYVQLYRRLLGI